MPMPFVPLPVRLRSSTPKPQSKLMLMTQPKLMLMAQPMQAPMPQLMQPQPAVVSAPASRQGH
jgi:hypothetical protein